MENRRSKRLIERAFQLRIIIACALTCTAGIFLVPGIFYVMVSRELETLKWKMTFRADPAAEIIVPALLSASIVALIFIGVTLFIVSWYFKSRTAKSLERIMEDLETVAEGNLSQVPKAEDTHFFQNVSKGLSLMVKGLRQRFRKTNRDFTVLKHMIDSLPDIREDLLPKKCTELNNRVSEMKKASKTS